MAIIISCDGLPPIPDKRYFTIGEAADLCKVKPHVLRYWEQEFKQLNPSRRENRRYYEHKDVLMARRIKSLLYKEGYTIEGARAKLASTKHASDELANNVVSKPTSVNPSIQKAINELEDILETLS